MKPEDDLEKPSHIDLLLRGENRQYKDIEGNPCSLEWLVRNEPEWAANQIRHRDKKLRDAMDRVVSDVIMPWREQAAIAEQQGDKDRREILDQCCEDLEAFILANAV